jgi:hypothetical protein
MPPGNAQAMVHYEDTIKKKVSIQRLSQYVSADLRARLMAVLGAGPIAVWGSEAGPRNRNSFDRMAPGDDVLIVEGDSVRLLGKIAAKTESGGFSAIAADKLQAFYQKYDDLYSVLVRLQKGEPVARKVPDPAVPVPKPQPVEAVEFQPDDIEEALRTELLSDHVKMQWTLAKLGLKAGERVWVPVGDQAKLQKTYDFASFDPEFAAGIDLPHSYVENIDVVWMQEFRIGAAYEIENSVVAPASRKNRLREQLRRPAFKRLELDTKVRFLSYETIQEIDSFFSGSNTGLNVDVIVGKSELVA